MVRFQMKANERFELLVEKSFWATSSRYKRRNGVINVFEWLP